MVFFETPTHAEFYLFLKHVSDVKVKYKWLDGGVEFVDAIPKNPSGKILVRAPSFQPLRNNIHLTSFVATRPPRPRKDTSESLNAYP